MSGSWIYTATALVHNGKQDDTGQPTYMTDADWSPIVTGWPCNLTSSATRSREVLRGQQLTAEATHIASGEYYGGRAIEPQHRLVIEGTTYGVVGVIDPDGLHRDIHILLKREL